jgi:hypothetical protein
MAKQMKRVAQTKKLPAKQPVPKGTERAASKTGKSIFDRADNGNRKLSKG